MSGRGGGGATLWPPGCSLPLTGAERSCLSWAWTRTPSTDADPRHRRFPSGKSNCVSQPKLGPRGSWRGHLLMASLSPRRSCRQTGLCVRHGALAVGVRVPWRLQARTSVSEPTLLPWGVVAHPPLVHSKGSRRSARVGEEPPSGRSLPGQGLFQSRWWRLVLPSFQSEWSCL